MITGFLVRCFSDEYWIMRGAAVVAGPFPSQDAAERWAAERT
jgi:hypothetical protein